LKIQPRVMRKRRKKREALVPMGCRKAVPIPQTRSSF